MQRETVGWMPDCRTEKADGKMQKRVYCWGVFQGEKQMDSEID